MTHCVAQQEQDEWLDFWVKQIVNNTKQLLNICTNSHHHQAIKKEKHPETK